MEKRTRRGWLIGVLGFGLGMGTMWGLQRVDLASLFTSGAGSMDALARASFDALRSGDVHAFLVHTPKQADLERMLEQIEAEGSERERKRARRKLDEVGGIEAMAAKHMGSNSRRFLSCLDDAREAGIDWSQATYLGVNEKTTKTTTHYGWEGGDVRFRVQSGGEIYEFELDNCACIDGTWRNGSGIFLVGSGRELPRAASTEVSQPAPASATAPLPPAADQVVEKHAEEPPRRDR